MCSNYVCVTCVLCLRAARGRPRALRSIVVCADLVIWQWGRIGPDEGAPIGRAHGLWEQARGRARHGATASARACSLLPGGV